jgi:hypothetical protein
VKPAGCATAMFTMTAALARLFGVLNGFQSKTRRKCGKRRQWPLSY